jgi:hypothetical protein
MTDPGRPLDVADAASPAPPPRAAVAAEPAAWAEVEARWGEVAVHHAYLARFPDLDGLTTAGRRYREVLARRPDDQVALAMKAEILKRATVVGLSMLPRSEAGAASGGRWKRYAYLLLAAWLGTTLAFLAWKLFGGTRL